MSKSARLPHVGVGGSALLGAAYFACRDIWPDATPVLSDVTLYYLGGAGTIVVGWVNALIYSRRNGNAEQ